MVFKINKEKKNLLRFCLISDGVKNMFGCGGSISIPLFEKQFICCKINTIIYVMYRLYSTCIHIKYTYITISLNGEVF